MTLKEMRSVIQPVVNCPLNPYGENRTPLGSCVLHCPNFKGFNKDMQVDCNVVRKAEMFIFDCPNGVVQAEITVI